MIATCVIAVWVFVVSNPQPFSIDVLVLSGLKAVSNGGIVCPFAGVPPTPKVAVLLELYRWVDINRGIVALGSSSIVTILSSVASLFDTNLSSSPCWPTTPERKLKIRKIDNASLMRSLADDSNGLEVDVGVVDEFRLSLMPV